MTLPNSNATESEGSSTSTARPLIYTIKQTLHATVFPVREHPASWSAVAAFLCSPFASLAFLAVFDSGSANSWIQILFLPIRIVWNQGLMVGLVVNSVLFTSTFLPIYLVAKHLAKRGIESPTLELSEHGPRITIPIRLRLLAIVDFVAGAGIALTTIDYPLFAVCFLGVLWPLAVGLWLVRHWGWWMGIIVHSLIAVIALIAYVVAMVLLAGALGRPRGHMELLPTEGAMIGLSLAIVVFELVASVLIWILLSNPTKLAFRQIAIDRPSMHSDVLFNGSHVIRTVLRMIHERGWSKPIIAILSVAFLMFAGPSLMYLVILWLVGGWNVR